MLIYKMVSLVILGYLQVRLGDCLFRTLQVEFLYRLPLSESKWFLEVYDTRHLNIVFWSLESYKITVYTALPMLDQEITPLSSSCKTLLFGSEKLRLRIFPFLHFPDVPGCKACKLSNCKLQEEQEELDYHKFIISNAPNPQHRDTKHMQLGNSF